MRLYAPLYEGDDTLRPDAALAESAAAGKKSPVPAPAIVRSNIALEAANETAVETPETVQHASELRNAGIVRMAKSVLAAIGEWLDSREYSERDSFFAASENLADLEQRQRHFERTGIAHY